MPLGTRGSWEGWADATTREPGDLPPAMVTRERVGRGVPTRREKSARRAAKGRWRDASDDRGDGLAFAVRVARVAYHWFWPPCIGGPVACPLERARGPFRHRVGCARPGRGAVDAADDGPVQPAAPGDGQP